MFCPQCGKELDPVTKNCLSCGYQTPVVPANVAPIDSNTSGQGSAGLLPPGIQGWSWGGFFLSWIWGLGNNVWIALLALIPAISFIMCIILGAKGREWAWKNKRWNSLEDFKKTQRTWGIVGLILFVLFIIPMIIFISIMSVAMLATLNPAEQVAKANDARAANNAIEIVNANEHYFAANQMYPWQLAPKKVVKYISSDNLKTENWFSKLVSTNNISSSFAQELSEQQNPMVLVTNTSDNSASVCYQPLSATNKKLAQQKCLDTTSINSQYPQLCQTGAEFVCLP